MTEQQLIDGNERVIFRNIQTTLNKVGFYISNIELTIDPDGIVSYSIDLTLGVESASGLIDGEGTLYNYNLEPLDSNANFLDSILYVTKKYILDRLWDIVGENKLLVEEGKIGAKFIYDATTNSLKGWLI